MELVRCATDREAINLGIWLHETLALMARWRVSPIQHPHRCPRVQWPSFPWNDAYQSGSPHAMLSLTLKALKAPRASGLLTLLRAWVCHLSGGDLPSRNVR